MPKTIFAVLVAAWLAISPASAASAQTNHIAVDGCANLARIVYTEVAAAAIYGPGKSGPWKIDLGKDDISLCDHTAKTVSRAFTSALLSAGIDVNWRIRIRLSPKPLHTHGYRTLGLSFLRP
jgi:hypothetical protein